MNLPKELKISGITKFLQFYLTMMTYLQRVICLLKGNKTMMLPRIICEKNLDSVIILYSTLLPGKEETNTLCFSDKTSATSVQHTEQFK